jgi:hypothetical protein
MVEMYRTFQDALDELPEHITAAIKTLVQVHTDNGREEYPE